MGFTIAMLQSNPKAKPSCIGIFTLQEDVNGNGSRVWVQTKQAFMPYKATMVTVDGTVIMSDCEAFLKELNRQSKLSQITYYYTEDEDLAMEYQNAMLIQ